MLDRRCGIDDWEIVFIGKGRNKQEARKKKLFWQYKLEKFVPHGLNERVVYLEWIQQNEAVKKASCGRHCTASATNVICNALALT